MWFFKEGYWKIALVASAIVVASCVYFEIGMWSPKVKPSPPPVVGEQQECRIWHEPININGHLAYLERCRLNNRETYRLYIGNEVLAEEVWENDVLLSKNVNLDLLKRLKKPKQKPTEQKKPEYSTKKTMFRYDI